MLIIKFTLSIVNQIHFVLFRENFSIRLLAEIFVFFENKKNCENFAKKIMTKFWEYKTNFQREIYPQTPLMDKTKYKYRFIND